MTICCTLSDANAGIVTWKCLHECPLTGVLIRVKLFCTDKTQDHQLLSKTTLRKQKDNYKKIENPMYFIDN